MEDNTRDLTGETAPMSEGEESSDEFDEETQEVIKYPIAVFFIVIYEFCERYVFQGVKVILVLYMEIILLYNENEATALFHVWNAFGCVLPVIGGIISDSCLGKFKTIFFALLCYGCGMVLLTLTNVPDMHLPLRITSFVALSLQIIGTGCVKPCITAFGGDQFVVPQQEKELQQFFSIFVFSVNFGSLCTKTITPFLKEDVHCFGSDTCYSLAYGVPGVVIIVGLIVFLLGFPWYKINPPGGNILVRALHCVFHALVRKRKLKKFESREHWLEYADDKFDGKVIADVKSVMGILYMLLPLPIYWALFDQQSSRWVFQAHHMDGYINENLSLPPDSMQLVNPFGNLVFIPLFETAIYPACAKIHMLTKSLQRITAGCIVASIAFFLAMFIELRLQKTYAVLPDAGEVQVRIFNGLNRTVELENWFLSDSKIEIDALDYKKYTVYVGDGRNPKAAFDIAKPYDGIKKHSEEMAMQMPGKKAVSFLLTVKDKKPVIAGNNFTVDRVKKSHRGTPLIRIIYNLEKGIEGDGKIKLKSKTRTVVYEVQEGIGATEFKEVKVKGHDNYEVFLPGLADSVEVFRIEFGGVYIIVVQNTDYEAPHARLYTVTKANTMHMLWLCPQYLLMAFSEVLFTIPGIEFCFTQAPKSMKAVMQSLWYFTNAIGNYIAAAVAEGNTFGGNQALEFMFYGILMAVFTVIFMLMSTTYTYVDQAAMEAATGERQDKTTFDEVRSLSNA